MKPSEMTRDERQQYIARMAYGSRGAIKPKYRAPTHGSATGLLSSRGPEDFRRDYVEGRIDVFEFEDRLDRYYGLRVSRLTS